MKKRAFTLAEVLITLGIIGVVAALTMPSLIANYKEKETVTRVKKVYSELSQAFLSAVNENGTPDNWNLIAMDDPEGNANMAKPFLPYLRIMNDCGAQGEGCFSKDIYKRLNGLDSTGTVSSNPNAFYMIRLVSGTSVAFRVNNPNCTGITTGIIGAEELYCGLIYVDTNGDAPPNTFGIDFFTFYMGNNKIFPMGMQTDTRYPFSTRCNKADTSDPSTSPNGFGCSAWVITNENMDYLHCNDLSWTGKTTCK